MVKYCNNSHIIYLQIICLPLFEDTKGHPKHTVYIYPIPKKIKNLGTVELSQNMFCDPLF